jgi:drug/metabolite transporter (DMT)-like permease
MQHVGPFTFNGVRFALGALSLLPLIRLRGRPVPPVVETGRRDPSAGPVPAGGLPASALGGALASALGGALAGTVLFLAASLQQVGIVHTTAGKAGFITGLYVVLVPVSGLLWGQRAGPGRWIGVLLAAAGLCLLSVTGRFTVGRGDLLVLLSALFWAAHVQVLGWLSPRSDPIRLSCAQFAVCALLSLLVALAAEPIRLRPLLAAAAPILYGGLGSVGIAYTLQVAAQRRAHPAHAAILLSLESVFAVLGGWLILGEALSPRGLLGCALMLAGMLASQVAALHGPAGR